MSEAIPFKTAESGFALPVLGLGTWSMATGDDERDLAAIDAALERGVTHVDTAEGYADGDAERLVGRAIEGRDRSRLFLVSKVSPRNLRYDDVKRAAAGSLERMGTRYLDLYLIHHPNPSIPIRETMRALEELVAEGSVRHVGVSNFAPGTLRGALAAAEIPIVANQVHYSLICREPERSGLVQACRDGGVMMIAWRPLERGLLARDRGDLLAGMARDYGKTPAQVAINWLIAQPDVVAIVKTSSLEHLDEDLGALGWELDAGDVRRLSTDFPGQQPVSNLVPLG